MGVQYQRGRLEQHVGVHLAEQPLDVLEPDGPAAERGELLECRDRVPHAAEGVLGDQGEGAIGDVNALGLADGPQPPHDVLHRETPEVEPLAAGVDRLGNLVGMRGAQDEHRALGGLLERLEQGVERRGGQHVHLVDDVHLPPAPGRRVVEPPDDLLTDVLDARS